MNYRQEYAVRVTREMLPLIGMMLIGTGFGIMMFGMATHPTCTAAVTPGLCETVAKYGRVAKFSTVGGMVCLLVAMGLEKKLSDE